MSERIYTTELGGKFEALEETPFAAEDELQALIAEHPELLDGEQIHPGNPRRWILITREKGISPSSSESARWAVDHLIVDQDAIPTLVEVKRSSNPEIRRTIVGQILEYAAHASETWTSEELRNAFLNQTANQGRDPAIALEALLQLEGEPDLDQFWEKVSTNLAAKRLRLLFVADAIPDPLARVVEFLNAQLPAVEVLAVEIKRFHGGSSQTLVPRVIGRTSASSARSRDQSEPRYSRDSFLDAFANEETRAVADRLLKTAEQSGGIVYYGTRGISIRIRCSAWRQLLSVAWVYPKPGVTGWMRTKDFSFGAAILEDDSPQPLRDLLDEWIEKFSADSFTEDVSSGRTRAWALSPEAAIKHQDVLMHRLRDTISDLASL